MLHTQLDPRSSLERLQRACFLLVIAGLLLLLSACGGGGSKEAADEVANSDASKKHSPPAGLGGLPPPPPFPKTAPPDWRKGSSLRKAPAKEHQTEDYKRIFDNTFLAASPTQTC